jgi:hypothetical protein
MTMDPIACINRITAALASGDRVEARRAYEDLRDWIESGGFVPVIVAAPTVTFRPKAQEVTGRPVVPMQQPLTEIVEVNDPRDQPGIVTQSDQDSLSIKPDDLESN